MEFVSVTAKEEALAMLQSVGDDATVLAGGTDVMVQYLRGEISPGYLIHIENLDELRTIENDEGRVSLGALTTHRRIATDPELSKRLPALAEAAVTVGGWQTQAVGTVAGNVCNASPAADLVAPLLVADAVVNLESSTGSRSLPLAEFIVDRRSTAREAEELVTSVDVVPSSARSGEVYLKVGRRGAMEVALVGLAVRVVLNGAGGLDDVAIAVCSVSPVPYRAKASESVLREGGLEREAIEEAAERLTRSASPITDFRADHSYRRRVLGPLLERGLTLAVERAAA